MKITILNGNSIRSNKIFDDYLAGLKATLEMASHYVKLIDLSTKEIKQCRGCWSCWIKTPGKCILIDDFKLIYHDLINCDLLIFASPITMGFVSSLIKKANDRMIPLVLPFFEIKEGEFHHSKRYKKYPAIGLILEKEVTTDDEDIQIINDIYKRTALNFHSELKFSHLITDSEKEIVHAINNI